jgi:hypothetical protein
MSPMANTSLSSSLLARRLTAFIPFFFIGILLCSYQVV